MPLHAVVLFSRGACMIDSRVNFAGICVKIVTAPLPHILPETNFLRHDPDVNAPSPLQKRL